VITVESSRRGRGQEAVAELTALAQEYPRDADLEVLLGMLHRDALGDPAGAAAHFAAAERLRALAPAPGRQAH